MADANVHMLCLLENVVAEEDNSIRFSDQDKVGVIYPNINPLVISTKILGVTVHRLLVDNGAFCNILFNSTLDQLDNYANYVEPCEHVIKGFRDATVKLYGIIKLAVELMSSLDREVRATRKCDFIIIDPPSTFNDFLDRPFEHDFEAVS